MRKTKEPDLKMASILIVDDEKVLLETLKDFLAPKGYQVTTCSNGNDAIRECKDKKHQIIIVDMRMPGMNGVELIKTIKDMDDKARFLVMTGYSVTPEDTDLIESFHRLHGYIFKPFELKHLEEKIIEILKSI